MHLTAEREVENPWMNDILRSSQVKILWGGGETMWEKNDKERSSQSKDVKEITIE